MRTAKIDITKTAAYQRHQFERGVCDLLGEKNGLLTLFQLAMNNPELSEAHIYCNRIQKSSSILDKEKDLCLALLNKKIQGNSAKLPQR